MPIDYSARSPADYILHRGPLLLLDSIVQVEQKRVVTSATITADNIFFEPGLGGVPSWVGLEYMAQSVAVWVGVDDERSHRPIQLGFLLGSRSYQAQQSVFAENKQIIIDVSADFIDGSIVVFNGLILDDLGHTLVSGNLTAFRPDDVDTYLEGKL